MNTKSLKVSVTALADFSCRVGDLTFGGNVGPTAREGIRAHQRIQSERSAEREVSLSLVVNVLDTDVTLSGRIDLVDSQIHRLSEIKSTMVPVDKLQASQVYLQWAQLKLYGFCYAAKLAREPDGVENPTIELELIHANLRADELSSEVKSFRLDELTEFAHEALSKYIDWYRIIWQWQRRTEASAKALEFPFKQYRTGQRDMAAAVYRATRDGETLLCEAPTGTGKTLSSLFPVVKAIGDGSVKHVAYLTAKTSGRASALQAVKSLESAGLHITAVLIRSKVPTCFCSNGRCERNDKNVCPMTIGFFDRLPAAREDAISAGVIDGDKLDAIAWGHQVCPFELALQLLPWVSVAISDYNYVFDPLVRIGRYNESRRDTVLLVDEAHNLVDRARSMHSGQLSRSELLDGSKELTPLHPLFAKSMKSLSSALQRLAPEDDAESLVNEQAPKNLAKKASEVVDAFAVALDTGPSMPEVGFDIFKSACRYNAINDLFGEQHRTVIAKEKHSRIKDVSVNLKCLDASSYLTPQYKIFHSVIVFSATLRPAPFYRDALGLPTKTRKLALESPFSPEKVRHCVVSYVNTRYQQRAASTDKLIEILDSLVRGKPGNYMAFLPSYAYLDSVYQAFVSRYPHVETWRQSRHDTLDDRDQLLSKLETNGTRLGFAILGGVFGEGIDYVGDRLIGVVIVGVGLPGLGVEQELIADCYRSQGLDGYDYAYRYPGFTKVLQTAGRVIRSELDEGVVLLVDDRFNQGFYRDLYPEHWRVDFAASIQDIEKVLTEFWSGQKKGPESKEVRAVSKKPKSPSSL